MELEAPTLNRMFFMVKTVIIKKKKDGGGKQSTLTDFKCLLAFITTLY